jgi:uncharacterized lipoprotein YddW (UPF0748 family)
MLKRIFIYFFTTTVSIIFLHLNAQSQSPHFEFRAVWIATVDNIDWPSKKGLSSEVQKEEFIKILDMHVQNGMNAIVMQIRPATDAFYPSSLEPWSEWLTGTQGQAPQPYYDPLEFMIAETHKRGMEFHAWFNPYRAVFNVKTSSIASSHVSKLFPHWFVTYGDKKYFDPGLPEVRQHVNRVIKDVVSRYDLDAIHFDDYFYPYRIAGKEFPDHQSFLKYGKGMTKDDWRRSNVDSIIKLLSETIKNTNSRVKFGISPFGIWRNKSKDPMGSETKGGQTNYDDLYADILLWLQKGWIDYVVPQLYWESGHALANYDVLLPWWANHNYGKQVYIGHGIYRAGTNAAWKNANEIPYQIKKLREYKEVQGSVYFSSKTFNKNPNGWNDSLQNNYYQYPALIPPMNWIDSISPEKPEVINLSNKQYFRITYKGIEPIKSFAIYKVCSGKTLHFSNAQLIKLITSNSVIEINTATFELNKADKLFVSSVDRNNNVSEWVALF